VWGLLHDEAVGLHGLHSYGIVHADLKCNNILITTDGRAQLIDFGLSCLSTCDGGAPLGAPRWKAPECLNGAGPTFASDVYSFGMCIIEARTGQLPWREHQLDIMVARNVKKGLLPAQPTLFSTQERELVRRMCRFNPQDRLQANEVVKVAGFFAQRDPYLGDQRIRETLAKWERDPLPSQTRRLSEREHGPAA
jgi:serine/threonine protein kinase